MGIDLETSYQVGAPVSPVQSKRGAEQYEREVREAVLAGTWRSEGDDERSVPTFASFAVYFLETDAITNNRPSTVREKHLVVGCSTSLGICGWTRSAPEVGPGLPSIMLTSNPARGVLLLPKMRAL